MSTLWDTQNLTGQDPEKPALQLFSSEQEAGLETSKTPFQAIQCCHFGVLNDSWANQKNTPQTTSATTGINVLQGKDGSDSISYVGSGSSHVKGVLCCWDKAIQRGCTLLWGGYCTGNLHCPPLSKSYMENSYEWIFLLGWWPFAFVVASQCHWQSKQFRRILVIYSLHAGARVAHTWFMIG